MLIGELSKRSGLTRDTIRFYEKENLIEPEKKGRNALPSNTYKDYPEAVIATLIFIQRTKVLGFTLGEIRELLKLREPGQKTSKRWVAEAEAKLMAVERKISELQDLKIVAKRATTVEEVNGAIEQASKAELKGILEYNKDPLVSVDFNHNPASSVFDSTLTKVSEGTLVKVCSWYDNEWGFSNRMLDTTVAFVNAK